MSRRRALMQGSPGLPGPIYKIENRAVSQSSISTGIKILDSDFDCSLLLDITLTSIPTSGVGRIFKFFTIWDSVNSRNAWCLGKTTNTSTHPAYFWYENQQISWNNITIASGRFRILGIHNKNSNTMDLYCKKDNGSIYHVTSTGTFSPLTNSLNIGSSGDAALPANTMINKCSIYNRIIDQGEIDNFFA